MNKPDARPLLLLNPGPVTLSARVRAAMGGPDLCHREPEFADLQRAIRGRLLQVYGLDPRRYAAILMTGSGTSAMEAMIASLGPANSRMLVIENGVYGERLSKIAAIHGMSSVPMTLKWGEAIDNARLRALLDEHQDVSHLAMVHHETTTGRLNAIDPIARLCAERRVTLLLDAVSSFGAEELDFPGWGIAACAATSNKCLHGVPGTSFVIARRDALGDDAPQRTLYLDLATYCREQDNDGTPFTQSVQSFYALAEALEEFEEQGGWRARHARYEALAEQVRSGLLALGIRPLLPEGASSVVLNAYHLPANVSYERLHDHLKAHGFVIYSGQGSYAKSIFRISTMGEITAEDTQRLLSAIAALLR
ncbi:MAG: 2-aminoethylphosphonate--pyruvate transaminase [Gammaproteobacteria bacterium]|nr:2-aminoethylphosphonate--pyruvate transaminase [Gammaproteobacteria bacterium]